MSSNVLYDPDAPDPSVVTLLSVRECYDYMARWKCTDCDRFDRAFAQPRCLCGRLMVKVNR